MIVTQLPKCSIILSLVAVHLAQLLYQNVHYAIKEAQILLKHFAAVVQLLIIINPQTILAFSALLNVPAV